MKIAFLLANLDDGGGQRVVVNLANYMSAQGHDVWLLSKNKGVFFHEIDAGVNFVLLPKKKMVANLFFMKAFLKKECPAVMLASLEPANFWAPLFRFFSGVDTTVIIREPNTLHRFKTRTKAITEDLKNKLRLSLMRFVYPSADAVVANSPDTLNDLFEYRVLKNSKKPKVTTRVIYNPIYSTSILQAAEEPASHPWVAQKIPYIVSVGRLTKQKDYPTLIRAFQLVRQQFDVNLIILGQGYQKEELVSLARELGVEEKIDFPGFRPNPYPFFAGAKVFALSSLWEGFGNVVVEALSVGTPVVATTCPGGPKVILENGRLGKLVEPGNYKEFAAAVCEVLENPLMFPPDMLQVRAKDFSIQSVGDQYLTFFSELTGESVN